MNELSLTGHDGHQIADWRSWTRPKAEYHWRAGRSAMELARAWFTSPVPVCPPEVESLLESHPVTAGVALTEGWPEYVTPLPERGEGRNHDLLLVGCRDGCGVVVSVEAKVDEPFGERIGDYWLRARESKRRTRAPERIEALVSMVFGSGTRPDAKPWSLLRYQLLTAVAGTAIEAAHRKSDTAVLIIHEFITHSADPAKVADNGRDLSDFVSVLFSEGADPMQPGRLNGPAVLAADKNLPRAVNVFIGKAVFSWRNNDGPDNPTN